MAVVTPVICMNNNRVVKLFVFIILRVCPIVALRMTAHIICISEPAGVQLPVDQSEIAGQYIDRGGVEPYRKLLLFSN